MVRKQVAKISWSTEKSNSWLAILISTPLKNSKRGSDKLLRITIFFDQNSTLKCIFISLFTFEGTVNATSNVGIIDKCGIQKNTFHDKQCIPCNIKHTWTDNTSLL